MHSFRKSVILLSIILSVILATGCFSPTRADTTTTTAQPGAASSATEPNASTGAAEERVLTVWDGQTDGEGFELYQGFADAFSAETGIKVNRIPMKTEDLRNTIKAAINSGEGPDVFSYDPGAGYLGVLAKSGLALDITEYAQQNGWNDRFQQWTLDNCTFGGRLYGVGNQIETLGVFYNKKIFADAGVKVPNTYDEFLAVCATLNDKGIMPIILDDLDQWPGFHLESMWLNAHVGNTAVADVLALKSTWDQPAMGGALDRLHDLVKSGYTVDNPNSIAYEDANKLFNSGKVAMRPTGTWMISDYQSTETGLGENAGFFFLPPADGVELSGPGGIGEAIVINGKSKVPEIALQYVDFMFSGDRVKQWYERSYIPSVEGANLDDYNLPGLFKEVASEILSAETMGYNIDVLMPAKVNDVTKNYIQELLAGKKTGAQCLAEKQAAYQEEIDAGKYEAVE